MNAHWALGLRLGLDAGGAVARAWPGHSMHQWLDGQPQAWLSFTGHGQWRCSMLQQRGIVAGGTPTLWHSFATSPAGEAARASYGSNSSSSSSSFACSAPCGLWPRTASHHHWWVTMAPQCIQCIRLSPNDTYIDTHCFTQPQSHRVVQSMRPSFPLLAEPRCTILLPALWWRFVIPPWLYITNPM